MTKDDTFVDYYDILEVSPSCSARALESAYHLLAKKYHPDHSEGGDVEKLTKIISAYKALRTPEKRAEYDIVYSEVTGFLFPSAADELDDERSAISDADAHAKILLFLYKRRREQAQDAGVGRYYVHQLLNCSDELFEFHLWYLKEKGFIVTTEHGTLAITIEGVDHVISTSRASLREKLLIAQAGDGPGKDVPH
ncbi:J domain-containing protein [Novosphingobium naphthalenivorans]|uniref:J domain-containing protein n=1 Tax=Novosphingobium naphthalenivorans TaxID=273168 RepID=UPI0008327194|nr:J domain-containing protein [Novosphingobium naphthalenivorans]